MSLQSGIPGRVRDHFLFPIHTNDGRRRAENTYHFSFHRILSHFPSLPPSWKTSQSFHSRHDIHMPKNRNKNHRSILTVIKLYWFWFKRKVFKLSYFLVPPEKVVEGSWENKVQIWHLNLESSTHVNVTHPLTCQASHSIPIWKKSILFSYYLHEFPHGYSHYNFERRMEWKCTYVHMWKFSWIGIGI